MCHLIRSSCPWLTFGPWNNRQQKWEWKCGRGRGRGKDTNIDGKFKLTSMTGILLFRVVPVPLARRLNCIDIGMISRSNPVRTQLSISLHFTVITCSSLITPCPPERPVNGPLVPCWGMTMLAVSFACKITTCTTEPGPGDLLDFGSWMSLALLVHRSLSYFAARSEELVGEISIVSEIKEGVGGRPRE